MPAVSSSPTKKQAHKLSPSEQLVEVFSQVGNALIWAGGDRIEDDFYATAWGESQPLPTVATLGLLSKHKEALRAPEETLIKLGSNGWDAFSDATLARGVLELFDGLSGNGRNLGQTRRIWNALRTHSCGQLIEQLMKSRISGISKSLPFQIRLKLKEQPANSGWGGQGQASLSSLSPALSWAHATCPTKDWGAAGDSWVIADAHRAMMDIALHAHLVKESAAHEAWNALMALRSIGIPAAECRPQFWEALAQRCPVLVGWLEAPESVLRHVSSGTGWGGGRWLPSLSLEKPDALKSLSWAAPPQWSGAKAWNQRVESTPQEEGGALHGLKPRAWITAIGFNPQWLASDTGTDPVGSAAAVIPSATEATTTVQAVQKKEEKSAQTADVEQLCMALQISISDGSQHIQEQQGIAAGLGLWLAWGAPEGRVHAQKHAQRWAQSCHPEDAARFAQEGWIDLREQGSQPLVDWYENFRGVERHEAFRSRRGRGRDTAGMPIGVEQMARQALLGLLRAGVCDAPIDQEGNTVLLKAIGEGAAALAVMLAQEHPGALAIPNQHGRFVADLALQVLSVERSKASAAHWDSIALMGMENASVLTQKARASISSSAQRIQKEKKHTLSPELFAAIEHSELRVTLSKASEPIPEGEASMPSMPSPTRIKRGKRL